jgi:uncharacterized peroxidase-related enzyme
MTTDSEPFIHLTPASEAKGDLKRLYDDLERVRGKGRVSNLFKAYGKFPALGEANFRRLNVLLAQGNLSGKLKEAVMVALAEINHCTYCVAFHATAMDGHGASLDEIAGARTFDSVKLGLSEKEAVLFEFALKANGDPHGIKREDVEKVQALGASDSDLVEILETVNTGNSFNLFAGALNIGADEFLKYSLEQSRFISDQAEVA